jgi:CRP/FNR family cyclic AMP-dependent transcriptional regulator
MKSILYFLGELNDRDIDWLVTKSHKRRLPVGTDLVRKGKGQDQLHFILEGEFSQSNDEHGRGKAARLGVGAVVGENAFLGGQAAVGTVRALTSSVVLSIPVSALTAKLKDDSHFAARFHRAVAKLAAHRSPVQGAHRAAGATAAAELSPDQLDMSAMDTVHLAGARFKHILARIQPA